jgi:hypothetical protein
MDSGRYTIKHGTSAKGNTPHAIKTPCEPMESTISAVYSPPADAPIVKPQNISVT